MQTQTSDFWKLFKPSACSVQIKSSTREEIFRELIANVVKAKQLPPEFEKSAYEALETREKLASTGVGQTVAIPHVRIEGLERAVVSLSVHPSGVEWAAVDGEPVHLFFLVLRPAAAGPEHDPERHLEMMKWVANMAKDGDFRRFAKAVANRTELVDLLKEKSGA